MVSVIMTAALMFHSFVHCRQAKLSATSKIIEDIDQSQGMQNYYITNRPKDKTVHVNFDIISRIIEKFWK